MAIENIQIDVSAKIDKQSFKKTETEVNIEGKKYQAKLNEFGTFTIKVKTKEGIREVQAFANDTKKALDPKEVIKFEDRFNKLTVAKKLAGDELRKIRKQYQEGAVDLKQLENAQGKFNNLSKATTEAGRELSNYRNTGDKDLSRLQAKFDETNNTIKQQGQLITGVKQTAEGFGKLARGQMSGLQDITKGATQAFSGLGSGITQALGRVGTLLASVFAIRRITEFVKSVDNARSEIVKLTGATGDLAKEFEGVARTVFRQVPEDLLTIATVVGEVQTRFGLFGKELETTSKQLLDFARITNQNPQQAVRDFSRLLADANIDVKDAGFVLDQLTVASQKSGIGINKLSETLVRYGVQLRSLGFNLTDSIALLAKFEREGVSTEKIFSGLSQALGRLAKAGVNDTAEAFRLLQGEIQATGSLGDALREAIEILGTRAGPDFALAIKEGRFAIDDYRDALLGAKGALSATAEEALTATQKFSILTNNLKGSFLPLIDRVLNTINPIIEGLIKFNEENEKLSDGLTLTSGVLVVIGGAIVLLGGKIALISGAVAGLIGIFVGLTNAINDVIREVSLYRRGLINLDGTLTELGKKQQETNRIIREAVKEYTEAQKEATVALKAFNNIKTDTSRTREQFDLLKQSALEAQNAIISLARQELARAESALRVNKALAGVDFGLGIGGPVGVIQQNVDRQLKILRDAEKEIKNIQASVFTTPETTPTPPTPPSGSTKTKQDTEELVDELEFVKREQEGVAQRMKEISEATRRELAEKASGYVDAFNDQIKRSEDTLKSLRSELENIGKELESIEKDIAKRTLSIEKELSDIDLRIGTTTDDGELQRLNQRRIELERELGLARQNVNQEVLTELRRQEKLNETERLLERQTQLQARQQELEKEVEFELSLQEDLTDKKEALERQFTITKQTELQRQTDLLRQYANQQIAIYRQIQSARESALGGGGGAGSSTTNVNQTFNQNITNPVDAQAVVNGIITNTQNIN